MAGQWPCLRYWTLDTTERRASSSAWWCLRGHEVTRSWPSFLACAGDACRVTALRRPIARPDGLRPLRTFAYLVTHSRKSLGRRLQRLYKQKKGCRPWQKSFKTTSGWSVYVTRSHLLSSDPFYAERGGKTLGHSVPPPPVLSDCLVRKVPHLWSNNFSKKTSKIGSTRCQILRLICTRFDFCLGLRRSPRPSSCVWQSFIHQGEGGTGGEEEKTKREKEVEFPTFIIF